MKISKKHRTLFLMKINPTYTGLNTLKQHTIHILIKTITKSLNMNGYHLPNWSTNKMVYM